MNKFISRTILAGTVFTLGISLVSNTALASAVLISSGATDVTGVSATLNGQVMNSDSNSFVWFEWSNNSAFYAPSIAGKQAFWGGRLFDASINGLTPGATYYYRAVAVARPISGGAESPVYSQVVSFKTTSPSVVANVVSTPAVASTQANTSTNNNSTGTNATAVKKVTPAQTTNGTKDGFTNSTNTGNGGASVLGAGDGILPGTLIGWIALLIAFVVILFVGRLIYEESEKRKKKRALQKQAATMIDEKTAVPA